MNKENSKRNSVEMNIVDKDNKSIKPIDKKKKRKRRFKYLFFSLVWLYILSSVFVTNIDTLLISEFQIIGTTKYITFKFLVFLLLLTVSWLIIGNRRFWKNIGLFFLFPLYPVFWIFLKNFLWNIPRILLMWKWHILLYYYIELLISFFVKIKFNTLKFSLFILSFLFMFNLHSNWLYIPIVLFVILQTIHIAARFKETFSPMKILKMPVGDLDDFLKTPSSPDKFDEIFEDESNEKDVSDEEKKLKNMERYLIINEFATAFNFKLKEIINRRIYMLSFLGKALFSFFLAMVYFGAINYCLFKINPNFFKTELSPQYFDFFYYSFFTIFPDGTDIVPISVISKIARMAGVSVGVVINLLLLTFYIAISSEKFKENLSKISKVTDKYTIEIQQHFKLKYGCNPADGIKRLKEMGSEIDSLIKDFRKHIK
jgi:hypothetical protein